jgi:hypothetical protein
MTSKLFHGLLVTVLVSAPCFGSAEAQDIIVLSALPAKVTEYKEAKAKYESSQQSYQDTFDMKNKVLQEQIKELKEYDPQIQALQHHGAVHDAEAKRQHEAIREAEQSCAGVKAGSARRNG